MMKMITKKSSFQWAVLSLILATLFFSISAWAAGQDQGVELSELAKNVTTSISALAIILNGVALVAGIGFVLASFFKFHQHKLNPTQVPISQGVTLLLIGAGLMLFPVMIPTAKNALFGKDKHVSTLDGKDITDLIGGNSGGSPR
jgi:intracellular multiplication protein IcmD